MNSQRKKSLIMAFAALLLASLACQSVQAPDSDSPTEETNSESSPANPTSPGFNLNPTDEALVQTGGKYDGSWSGTNSDDSEIFFDVSKNEITSVTINYRADVNGCTFSGAVSMGIDPSPIDGEAFAADFTAANNYGYNFTGSFSSETEASGTILVKGPSSGLCGEFEKELTWIAVKSSEAAAEPAPIEQPGDSTQSESGALVTEFFDAVNAGDVDAAVALADQNIMFTIGSQTAKFGPSALKSYLTSTQGVTYEISDVDSLGGAIIQFKAEASDGKSYPNCQMFVESGKIIMLTLK